MHKKTFTQEPSRKKWWPYLAVLIILGLAVHFLLPQIPTIEKSLEVLKNMIWWLVALASFAQVMSYVGSGYTLQAILNSREHPFSIWRGILITLASYSVGLVAGGWVGGAAVTYNWIHKDNSSPESAALASILPSLLNNAALTAVSIIGVIYLFFIHDLTKLQILGYGLVLVLLTALLLFAIFAIKRPEVIKRYAVKYSQWWAKLRRRDYQPEKTIASVERVIDAWKSLDQGRWVRPAIGAFAGVVFDMISLYLIFLAAGYRLNISVLFAGYGLPLMLGKIAFILPGGVGVIESSMVALFESLQVPSDVAVISILGYRLLSFWVPILFGFLAALLLGRNQTIKTTPKDSLSASE